jgi:hypothetical protein
LVVVVLTPGGEFALREIMRRKPLEKNRAIRRF